MTHVKDNPFSLFVHLLHGLVQLRPAVAEQAIEDVASQTLGAIAASILLRGMFPQHPTLGATSPAGTGTQSFILEIVLTLVLMFVLISGTAVALTRKPVEQAVGLSFYGLVLALMFLVFQAPDVALSQIAVGAVALPLMILLALAKIRRCKQGDESKD